MELPKESQLEETNAKGKAFKCQYCMRDFNSFDIKHPSSLNMCNYPDCLSKGSRAAYQSSYSDQNFLKQKRENSMKPLSCNICNKSFNSNIALKQHMEMHKNQFARSKFVCFIDECSKSYLYVCTLKKHIQATHTKEYSEIMGFYGEDINFISVFKDLMKGANRFPFIKMKNCNNSLKNNNNSDGNQNLPEKTKVNQAVQTDDISNEYEEGMVKVKEELRKYFLQSMNNLKSYFDQLSNEVVQKCVPRGYPNSLPAFNSNDIVKNFFFNSMNNINAMKNFSQSNSHFNNTLNLFNCVPPTNMYEMLNNVNTTGNQNNQNGSDLSILLSHLIKNNSTCPTNTSFKL